MESNAPDKPVPREINALLSDERLILRETQRAVTPFGGIAVFIFFLSKIGFVEAVRQHMPVRWRSPNHIDPSSTFTAFLVSVLVGARRFAHASLLRGDRALHALLGMNRFPTDDTIRNLFRQFGMGQVQRLFEPLAEWQMQRLPQRPEGYTFRVFVTSCGEAPQQIWRDYNRRADMENRIAELKHDLGADGFCMKQFFATEAAFRAVLLLFNLLAEFQRAAGLPLYREPATLRTQILTCGAILGRAGRRLVIHLSESWGGLKTRIPLLDSILNWEIPTSPKLESVLQT